MNTRCIRLASRTAAILGASTLAIVLQASAYGAERPKIPKIAVLDVKTCGGVDQKSVGSLSALIASEAARYPVRVIAGSDLATLLGFEKQKQLLGCTDTNCLAEVGGGLGVEYLLSTEIGEVGGRRHCHHHRDRWLRSWHSQSQGVRHHWGRHARVGRNRRLRWEHHRQ